jgi:hypothetical protein
MAQPNEDAAAAADDDGNIRCFCLCVDYTRTITRKSLQFPFVA